MVACNTQKHGFPIRYPWYREPVPVLGCQGCGGIFPESSPQLVNEKINPVPVRLGAVLYFDPGILQTW
jgi:hypothetical protein